MTDDTDNIVNLPKPKKPRTPDAIANELGERLTPKRPLTPKQREHLDRLNANRIPSGTPRGGNGPAGGQGWGGPAKGAGQAYGVKGGAGGRPVKAISQMKAEERAILELELQELKLTRARTAENEMTRLSAINSLENRLMGLPPAKVAHVGGDEDDNPIKTAITVEFVRAKTNP